MGIEYQMRAQSKSCIEAWKWRKVQISKSDSADVFPRDEVLRMGEEIFGERQRWCRLCAQSCLEAARRVASIADNDLQCSGPRDAAL